MTESSNVISKTVIDLEQVANLKRGQIEDELAKCYSEYFNCVTRKEQLEKQIAALNVANRETEHLLQLAAHNKEASAESAKAVQDETKDPECEVENSE